MTENDPLDTTKPDETRLSIEIKPLDQNGWSIVSLVGRLDVLTYVQLKQAIDPLLEDPDGACIIFDMTGVSFVASSGWSVCLAARTHLKRTHGKVGMVGLGPELERAHQAMKMNELIPAYATAAEAQADLKAL